MQVIYKSRWYKVMSVFRYYYLRLFYGSKFKCSERSMIGKRCGFYVQPGGSIICDGRIILNDDVMVYSKGVIKTGANLGINKYSRIVAHEAITIGSNVTVGQMVTIIDHDHHYEMNNEQLTLQGYDTAPVNIGSNVWIGDKATILKGVTIGDNVIIGAHSLINKDVPANVVVAGNPFKVIKEI